MLDSAAARDDGMALVTARTLSLSLSLSI